jgi:hypothetical protein
MPMGARDDIRAFCAVDLNSALDQTARRKNRTARADGRILVRHSGIPWRTRRAELRGGVLLVGVRELRAARHGERGVAVPRERTG